MIKKFSVIVPTCNRPKLLGICVEKLILAIRYSPVLVEIIVTEDGASTSQELISWLNDSGVVYIKGPAQGPASNRNNGAAHATGDWLIFIDDDCEPDINIYRAYFQAVKKHIDCFVFEGCTTVPQKG